MVRNVASTGEERLGPLVCRGASSDGSMLSSLKCWKRERQINNNRLNLEITFFSI